MAKASRKSAGSRKPSAWNKFVKKHAGKGHSRSELSAMYKAQQGGKKASRKRSRKASRKRSRKGRQSKN